MIEMDQPCRLDGPHPEHPVVDLIADPDHERVFYGDSVRTCPGLTYEQWRERRGDTP